MMPVHQLAFAIVVATAVQQMAAATTTMKSTTKKVSTTTLTTMMTTTTMTTTTGTGAATTYTGSMTLQLADAQAFVDAGDNATATMEHSIAAANADITQEMVDVTSIALLRRLSAKPRGLSAGGVKVDYTVTYPAGHSLPALTASSFNTDTLTTAIQTKAQEFGLSVNVTGVVVDEPTMQTPGTTTASASDGATTLTGLLALVSAVLMAALAV